MDALLDHLKNIAFNVIFSWYTFWGVLIFVLIKCYYQIPKGYYGLPAFLDWRFGSNAKALEEGPKIRWPFLKMILHSRETHFDLIEFKGEKRVDIGKATIQVEGRVGWSIKPHPTMKELKEYDTIADNPQLVAKKTSEAIEAATRVFFEEHLLEFTLEDLLQESKTEKFRKQARGQIQTLLHSYSGLDHVDNPFKIISITEGTKIVVSASGSIKDEMDKVAQAKLQAEQKIVLAKGEKNAQKIITEGIIETAKEYGIDENGKPTEEAKRYAQGQFGKLDRKIITHQIEGAKESKSAVSSHLILEENEKGGVR